MVFPDVCEWTRKGLAKLILLIGAFGVLCMCGACSSDKIANKSPEKCVKLVLDLDTGIDDALALAYAVGSENVDLLGILGSYGNVKRDEGLRNTLDLLMLLGRPEVPVYAGAQHALGFQGEYEPSAIVREIHGQNGIGNVKLAASKEKVQEEDAVDFLIRMANTHGKELTVVAVGPLTNVATAMERDPQFAEKVGRIVFMGGALTVPGNSTVFAEANIHTDPLAARKVLKSKAKVTMVGLDATHRTLTTDREISKWRALQTPAAIAYSDMAKYCLDVSLLIEPAIKGCPMHDPLAVAVAIDPSWVTTLDMFMEVGVDEVDYGRTIGDKSKLLEENPNVSVCINVDHERFNKYYFELLYHLFERLK